MTPSIFSKVVVSLPFKLEREFSKGLSISLGSPKVLNTKIPLGSSREGILSSSGSWR